MRKLGNEEISKLANQEMRKLANQEMRGIEGMLQKMQCFGVFVANNAK